MPAIHAITVEQEQQFMYYWYAARQAITDERYQEAFALLQFCNTIKPDDAKTLSFLGVIYESLHKEDIAKEFYKKAYEVDPANNWQNWLEPLKQDYIAQGEWKKALKLGEDQTSHRSHRCVLEDRSGQFAFSAFPAGMSGTHESEEERAVCAVRTGVGVGSL